MAWSLLTTRSFDRQARKFIRQHPDLKSRLGEVLAQLQVDPFDLALRFHALSGTLDGLQAVRINYRYRIVLTLQIQAEEILLIDIGSHDEVYR